VSNPSLALVTGAGGFVGQALIHRLLGRGFAVRALVRPDGSRPDLPPEVEVLTGDVADPTAVQQAVAGVQLVFHLAAKLHVNRVTPEMEAEYRRVNLEGSQLLARAARTAGVRRFVFFSTINVYGPCKPGTVCTEDSPTQPDSVYGTTKLEAESSVLAETPAVVLRLAAVYGPGMKGNYARLVRGLRTGRLILVGDGSNRRTILHVTDACDAAILSAEHPVAENRIYNVTDGGIHTVREIIAAICSALGRRPPRLRLPVWPVRLGVGAVESTLRLVGIRFPVSRAQVDKLTEDVAVSGERLQREVGFRPAYDLIRGWKETVAAGGY
jgi:UDP-glucose 4-epimerase